MEELKKKDLFLIKGELSEVAKLIGTFNDIVYRYLSDIVDDEK